MQSLSTANLPPRGASLRRQSWVIFALIAIWIITVVGWSNNYLREMHEEHPDHAFGVMKDNWGSFYLQDFSYNMIFLKGVRDRLVPNPYRLDQQEELVRELVPGVPAGMAHGYSPVLYALMWPLMGFDGATLYTIYSVLGAVATLLLLVFYLLPRAITRTQLFGIAAAGMGICLSASFVTGQSTLITTPLLALFWVLLQKRENSASIALDGLLALVFWTICLKPSVALIPFFVLIGARQWRILIIGIALLLATWIATASHYGGWWTGMKDYYELLSHYHPADFPLFMRRDLESPVVHSFSPYFQFCFFVANFALIVARWRNVISASEHFQGAIWAFLLLVPYLLGSEHWALVLLVVEGTFFAVGTPLTSVLKLALIFGVLDLRLHVNSLYEFNVPSKWILFLWILSVAISQRVRRDSADVPSPAVL